MRPYAERREARIARLYARSDAKQSEADGRLASARRIADVIPMGQPILVGHHSERHHRRDIARIDQNMRKGIEASKEATDLRRRAAAAENNDAVSSDDPDAILKLKAKIEVEKRTIEQMKRVNAIIRVAQRLGKKTSQPWEPIAKADLVKAGFTSGIERVVEPDFAGRVGFAPYELTNRGANVRRMEQRIAVLEASAVRAATVEPEQIGDVKIEESENRVRLYFPDKPAEKVRDLLKSRGFRWSPSEGAWQRHASGQAWYEARVVAAKVAGFEPGWNWPW